MMIESVIMSIEKRQRMAVWSRIFPETTLATALTIIEAGS
jgi:hypothetical protein